MTNEDELDEPEPISNKLIQHFSSFGEANEADAKQMAAVSPV